MGGRGKTFPGGRGERPFCPRAQMALEEAVAEREAAEERLKEVPAPAPMWLNNVPYVSSRTEERLKEVRLRRRPCGGPGESRRLRREHPQPAAAASPAFAAPQRTRPAAHDRIYLCRTMSRTMSVSYLGFAG